MRILQGHELQDQSSSSVLGFIGIKHGSYLIAAPAIHTPSQHTSNVRRPHRLTTSMEVFLLISIVSVV